VIPTDSDLTALASQLGSRLIARKMKLASAESCTGGWLAKTVTDLTGSSEWFDGAVVSYSNSAKQRLLGVNEGTLQTHGAVSRETVLEMTSGIFENMDADIAVSISGIAGPGGGSSEKPVGLVWMSWGRRNQPLMAECYHFDGDREAVRRQAVEQALRLLMDGAI
jgi:nicotinamide-nucleotide amidase